MTFYLFALWKIKYKIVFLIKNIIALPTCKNNFLKVLLKKYELRQYTSIFI